MFRKDLKLLVRNISIVFSLITTEVLQLVGVSGFGNLIFWWWISRKTERSMGGCQCLCHNYINCAYYMHQILLAWHGTIHFNKIPRHNWANTFLWNTKLTVGKYSSLIIFLNSHLFLSFVSLWDFFKIIFPILAELKQQQQQHLFGKRDIAGVIPYRKTENVPSV